MSFLVYEKRNNYLEATGEHYRLAGYNLIYNLWLKSEKPTNQGWHMGSDEIIREYTAGKGTLGTHSLLIDFHPGAKRRVGIIELLDIYAYTYAGNSSKVANWTPMMLRLRDILYEEYDTEITKEEKSAKISRLSIPSTEDDFIEFLYLNGTDRGWNWGRNGMTNAAFIQEPARAYFRQFF